MELNIHGLPLYSINLGGSQVPPNPRLDRLSVAAKQLDDLTFNYETLSFEDWRAAMGYPELIHHIPSTQIFQNANKPQHITFTPVPGSVPFSWPSGRISNLVQLTPEDIAQLLPTQTYLWLEKIHDMIKYPVTPDDIPQIFFYENKYHIDDGHHRLAAAILAQRPAVVKTSEY